MTAATAAAAVGWYGGSHPAARRSAPSGCSRRTSSARRYAPNTNSREAVVAVQGTRRAESRNARACCGGRKPSRSRRSSRLSDRSKRTCSASGSRSSRPSISRPECERLRQPRITRWNVPLCAPRARPARRRSHPRHPAAEPRRVSANLGVHTSFTAGVRSDVRATRFDLGREHRGIEDADAGATAPRRRAHRPSSTSRSAAIAGPASTSTSSHSQKRDASNCSSAPARVGLPEIEVEDGR